MPYNRLIPVILLKDGGLYKTRKFKNPVYIGDPINTVKIFNELKVDELIILDFMNSKNNSIIDFDLLSEIATEAFMPLSYGGGIASIAQIRKLFSIGFEKVVINTAFLRDLSLIQEAVTTFGSQSITIGIDYTIDFFGRRKIYSHSSVDHNYDSVSEAIADADRLNVGEIFISCVSNDGEMKGIDKEFILSLHRKLNLPIIACGGLKNIDEINDLFLSGIEAVAGGGIFVFKGKQRGILVSYPEEVQIQRQNR